MQFNWELTNDRWAAPCASGTPHTVKEVGGFEFEFECDIERELAESELLLFITENDNDEASVILVLLVSESFWF